jgi:hypothetical protein
VDVISIKDLRTWASELYIMSIIKAKMNLLQQTSSEKEILQTTGTPSFKATLIKHQYKDSKICCHVREKSGGDDVSRLRGDYVWAG